MSEPSEAEIRAACAVASIVIPPVGWAGFVVCVARRVRNGTDLWDAVEQCAEKYK